ncbi:MAG TPA: hypothetical protein VGS28_04475 [Candidatus Saccharimonadales bacterium]|nr:hypothetical protein [Candidatus Saccharimonadales bacterium]
MKHNHSQAGVIDSLLIPVIVLCLLVAGLAVFAVKEYGSAQDYKNNVDQKIQVAVAAAETQQQARLQAQFAQEEKQPYVRYTAPQQFGSVSFNFPRTWSVYVGDDGSTGDGTYTAYFNPNSVPPTSNNDPYALELSVNTSDTYSNSLQSFQGQVGNGLVAAPVKLARGNGMELSGAISNTITGTMIVFPLRGGTVELSSQSPSFLADFTNTVLPSLTWSP